MEKSKKELIKEFLETVDKIAKSSKVMNEVTEEFLESQSKETLQEWLIKAKQVLSNIEI